MMFNLLALGLVIAGTGLLLGALVPISRLIRQIPPGSVRQRWYVMVLLVGGFVFGYVSYEVLFWSTHIDWASLIVPVVFFFGSIFVFLTAQLSLQTAVDVRRVVLLEKENIMDPLIGIYNRRYLDRRLEEEFQRARRYGLPLAILVLDIDHRSSPRNEAQE